MVSVGVETVCVVGIFVSVFGESVFALGVAVNVFATLASYAVWGTVRPDAVAAAVRSGPFAALYGTIVNAYGLDFAMTAFVAVADVM